MAADNSASAGSSNNMTSITDGLGNTWTKQTAALVDPGAASAGAQHSIFTTMMDKGVIQSSTVLTFTNANACTAKAWTMIEVVPADYSTVEFVQQNIGSSTAATTWSIVSASITNGNMIIGSVAIEGGTGNTITGDSDTLNGNWAAQQTTSVGTTTTGMGISSQTKVVNASGAQTYSGSYTETTDSAISWIEVKEVARNIPRVANVSQAVQRAASW